MTAFTITSPVNIDTLTPKTGGDTYTINGGELIIDSDTRYSKNATPTTGSLWARTISSTLWGKIKIDGKNCFYVAYTGGIWNVPVAWTTISQGGTSAELLGVWSAWNVPPTTAGSAMPATWYIKFKNKTGSFSAWALTGIGATCSGVEEVWVIEVNVRWPSATTVPRLWDFIIDWDDYYAGVTTGVRGQTIQLPASLPNTFYFYVEIETSPWSNIYEKYPTVILQNANSPTDEVTGKVVFRDNQGLITIGSDGINNVFYLPPAGCKIRTPNIVLTTTSTTGFWTNTLVASLLGRWSFTTTWGGAIDIRKCHMLWYMNLIQAFSVRLEDVWYDNACLLIEVASPLLLKNNVCSYTFTSTTSTGFNIQYCTNKDNLIENDISVSHVGGNLTHKIRFDQSVATIRNANHFYLTTTTSSTVCGILALQSDLKIEWTIQTIWGRNFFSQATTFDIENILYGQSWISPASAAFLSAVAIDIKAKGIVRGFSVTDPLKAPYWPVFLVATSWELETRNIGTFASPIDLGNRSAYVFSHNTNAVGKMKRCYFKNTRTGFILWDNSTPLTIENSSWDYNDNQNILGINSLSKWIWCTNSVLAQSSVYWYHFADIFNSETTGRLVIACNEPTTETASYVITTGTARFTSANGVIMPTLWDSVTWEWQYKIKGHTGFQNTAPTLTGTNTGNMSYEYALDTGSGYGAWTLLSGANLSAETISSDGFKIKVRVTTITADTGNVLNFLRIDTTTTATDQSTKLYPLDLTNVTFTGVEIGANVGLIQSGVLYANEVTTATTHTIKVTDYIENPALGYTLRIRKPWYEPLVFTLTDEWDIEIPVQQIEILDITGLAIYNRWDDSTSAYISFDSPYRRIDIGNIKVTAEDLFDVYSEYSITDTGMLAPYAMKFDGRDILLLDTWILRRKLIGDTNAGIDANVTSEANPLDNPVDEVNGSVQIYARAVRNADGGAGGGIDEVTFHAYLDSYANKDDWKATIPTDYAKESTSQAIKTKTDTLVNTDLTGIATTSDVVTAKNEIIAEIGTIDIDTSLLATKENQKLLELIGYAILKKTPYKDYVVEYFDNPNFTLEVTDDAITFEICEETSTISLEVPTFETELTTQTESEILIQANNC